MLVWYLRQLCGISPPVYALYFQVSESNNKMGYNMRNFASKEKACINHAGDTPLCFCNINCTTRLQYCLNL